MADKRIKDLATYNGRLTGSDWLALDREAETQKILARDINLLRAGDVLEFVNIGAAGRTTNDKQSVVLYIPLPRSIAAGTDVAVHITGGNIYSDGESQAIKEQEAETLSVSRGIGILRIAVTLSRAVAKVGPVTGDTFSGRVTVTASGG